MNATPALRDPLARAMLAAWVNCAPDQLPAAMQAHTCAATMEAWQRVGRAALNYFATTASAPAGDGVAATIPVGAFPERIGQLCRGEHLSDGEDRICAGGCEQPIPAGHAIYWPERLGEYPDDIDPSCISCAIDRSEREQGWCVCNTPDPAEALARPRAAVGERAWDGVVATDPRESADDTDEDGNPCWYIELQSIGGHSIVATIYGGSPEEVQSRADAILALQSPPAKVEGVA